AGRGVVAERAVGVDGEIAAVRARGRPGSGESRIVAAVGVAVVGEETLRGVGLYADVADSRVGVGEGDGLRVDGAGDERGVCVNRVVESHAGGVRRARVGDGHGVGDGLTRLGLAVGR